MKRCDCSITRSVSAWSRAAESEACAARARARAAFYIWVSMRTAMRYGIAMICVIDETESLVIIDKPSGLIVHRDGRNDELSVSEWVGQTFPKCRGVGGEWVSPQGESIALNGAVHRLDRETSGVLLIAKTQEMFEYLRAAFKARQIEKTYRAIVYGHMREESGEIIAEVVRTKTVPRRWEARPCEPEDVRAAITEWRVLSRVGTGEDAATHLELSPKTGRTHQLRVHLASIGYPIVGDKLYANGREPIRGMTRLALHAYQIAVTIQGKRHSFSAPEPGVFARAMQDK